MIQKSGTNEEVASFSDFAWALQEAYLELSGGKWKESIKISPLVQKIVEKTGIRKAQVEKFITDTPRIFIGIADLRPFTGEEGIEIPDRNPLVAGQTSTVSRLFLGSHIVGL